MTPAEQIAYQRCLLVPADARIAYAYAYLAGTICHATIHPTPDELRAAVAGLNRAIAAGAPAATELPRET